MCSIKHKKKIHKTEVSETLPEEDGDAISQSIIAREGLAENEYISVKPTFLKFPHDDASQNTKCITIWNKGKDFLSFRIEEPKSKFFTIFYEKNGIYGGAEIKVVIKCKPYDQKMCFDNLKIHLTNKEAETLKIPLDLIPSISWFSLPRVIEMPNVPIGSSAEYEIKLPMPPFGLEPFNFFISGTKPEEIEISTTEGRVGPGLIEKLILKYTPTKYTSLTYQLSMHFPQVVVQPFRITVYMRCAPGLESAVLTTTTEQILNARAATLKAVNETIKLKSCRGTNILKISPVPVDPEETSAAKPDLCTAAGVMKFLLQRGGKVHWSKEYLGPMGLTSVEEQRIYKNKEKEFHDKFVRIEIQQRNSLIQPTKTIHGDDPIQSQPDRLERIIRDREFAELKYQKALGMRDNDIEDMTRRKIKVVRQRIIRDVDTTYNDPTATEHEAVPVAFDFGDMDDVSNGQEWIRKHALHHFIQAALIIITRKRADKRIAKLKILIKETKKARKKAAAKEKADEVKAERDAELKALKPGQADFLAKLLAGSDKKDSEGDETLDDDAESVNAKKKYRRPSQRNSASARGNSMDYTAKGDKTGELRKESIARKSLGATKENDAGRKESTKAGI